MIDDNGIEPGKSPNTDTAERRAQPSSELIAFVEAFARANATRDAAQLIKCKDIGPQTRPI